MRNKEEKFVKSIDSGFVYNVCLNEWSMRYVFIYLFFFSFNDLEYYNRRTFSHVRNQTHFFVLAVESQICLKKRSTTSICTMFIKVNYIIIINSMEYLNFKF